MVRMSYLQKTVLTVLEAFSEVMKASPDRVKRDEQEQGLPVIFREVRDYGISCRYWLLSSVFFARPRQRIAALLPLLPNPGLLPDWRDLDAGCG